MGEYERVMRKLTSKLPDGREFTLLVKLEDDEYWWTEGNMGCDCNRMLEIARHHNSYVVPEELNCGETIELIRVDPEWPKEGEL